MSEQNPPGEATPTSPTSPPAGADSMEQAMLEAVEAVEAVEARSKSDVSIEMGEEDDPDEEEVVVGPTPGEAVTEALIQAKAELEEMLEKTKTDANKLRDKWLRSAADLENFKKRASREREEAIKYGNERLLKDLLPVFDDLERTVDHLDTDETAIESIKEGLLLVHKKFLAQLQKQGVSTFSSAGETFDPMQHEAVQQIFSEEVPSGAVASEMRRGFFLNGRLLRPAMVAVSMGAEKDEAADAETENDAAGEESE